MPKKKLSLATLLNKMTARKRAVCRRVYDDFKDSFESLPGGLHNHQVWRGGYRDHVEEVMNIGCLLYIGLNSKRKLPFSLGDTLFVLFLHDMDKLLRFEKVDNKVIQKHAYGEHFVKKIGSLLRRTYHYQLSADELNALQYTHGEGKDYSPTQRVMKPLTALVHCCDIISARIWFDYGRNEKNW
ncbi:MAG: hypothetical protein Q7R62_02680 [bacterium]|nr:hypothetical protein [bacterium]